MIFCGIDPGITGAVAAITGQGRVKLCAALPIMRNGKLAWCDGEELVSLLSGYNEPQWIGPGYHVTIERAQPMPKQGVSSTFGYGVMFGSILQAMHWARVELVTASQWKRAMGLTSDKQTSLDKARMLFPGVKLDRKCDHNRAEALLIAEWARAKSVKVAA